MAISVCSVLVVCIGSVNSRHYSVECTVSSRTFHLPAVIVCRFMALWAEANFMMYTEFPTSCVSFLAILKRIVAVCV